MTLSPYQLLQALPNSVPFVDHTGIQWNQVRRTHYWMYQRFNYEYPGPVKNLHQRLIVVPPTRHGNQHLEDHKLRVSNAEVGSRSEIDPFGNLVYYLDLPHVAKSVNFEIWCSVERQSIPETRPFLDPAEARVYLEPSRLTMPDPGLEAAAKMLAACESDPWRLAEAINTWVYESMQYKSGVTNVATTASEALKLGQGLCQDYSHIMLAVCRLAGLPARYVSGHLLGEGGSHAWLEVLLPSPVQTGKLEAVAFDPTNHCRAGLRHITVAVGRDYYDVSPTSGYFDAPYQGRLQSSKRAGLILVEYFDGLEITVDDSEIQFLEETRWVA
jgi:transglutaminase-like putative cysteine protease